jgi:hypothetical protein
VETDGAGSHRHHAGHNTWAGCQVTRQLGPTFQRRAGRWNDHPRAAPKPPVATTAARTRRGSASSAQSKVCIRPCATRSSAFLINSLPFDSIYCSEGEAAPPNAHSSRHGRCFAQKCEKPHIEGPQFRAGPYSFGRLRTHLEWHRTWLVIQTSGESVNQRQPGSRKKGIALSSRNSDHSQNC